MIVLYYFVIILLSLYILVIFSFLIGFFLQKKSITKNKNSDTKFSIVVPFRNEEENLFDLLESINRINYPKSNFEIFLVNDDSSDKSLEVINEYSKKHKSISIHLINNIRTSNSPKKDAILTAINQSKFDWIFTTDADCILPKKLLLSFNTLIKSKNANMIVGPVKINANSDMLEQFQAIDFLSMQGATIGSFGIQKPLMANGANLAYRKSIFYKLNGFNSNNHIASGDDVFLLENFLDFNKSKVHYIKNKDALVITKPTKSWRALIQQRKRWAAKTSHFKSSYTKCVGVSVFFGNISFIIALFMFTHNKFILSLILFKIIFDAFLIFETAKLYQQKLTLTHYLKTFIFHPFFTIYIALACKTGSFKWKERTFRK